MTATTYTGEQIASAEKIAEILAKAPEDKRGEIVQFLEAMVIGAEIASKAQAAN